MGKYRFAIIGCGKVSRRHAQAIKELGDVAELVAVSDIDENKAKTLAQEYNVKYYVDYREMLKDPTIDIISICTPNVTHPKIGIEAANAGKHVLTEKPISINLKDADELIKTCKEKNRKLVVVKQVRLNPTIQKLKELIDKGRIGDILSANVTLRWNRDEDYYRKYPWHGKKDIDGGTLITVASHYIDILQWLLGPVNLVYGKIKPHKIPGVEVEGLGAAVIEFKSGALATIEYTTRVYRQNLECSMIIIGEKGTVKLGGNAFDKIEYWDVENEPNPKIKGNDIDSNHKTRTGGVNPNHTLFYKYFIDALEHKLNLTDGEDARKSIEIIQAIYRSAETGRPIEFL